MSNDPASAPRRRTFLSALGVYTERPALVMVALGFSAGLPYFLIFDTLSAWLRASGLSLEVIGFFSLVTLVSTFKFLWAPFVDRTPVPMLTPWLGHRRSWMLRVPGRHHARTLARGRHPIRRAASARSRSSPFLVGFSSATQDIAIDAWRIEAAEVSKQGAMAAAYQWGYRVAIIVAGAVPLLLAEAYGWNFSYAVMAALMTVGVAGVLAAPREQRHTIRPIQTEGIPPAPAREALEWVVRLALLGVGALVLGSGLAANAGVLARRARCHRRQRCRATRSSPRGRRRTRVGAAGGGGRRYRPSSSLAATAASRRAHAARRLPLVGARRSAARFLLALPVPPAG